jgi:hypothetical protein
LFLEFVFLYLCNNTPSEELQPWCIALHGIVPDSSMSFGKGFSGEADSLNEVEALSLNAYGILKTENSR